MLSRRTPIAVTLAVWHALLLREIGTRITADRFSWTWLFIEPVAYIGIFAGLRELLGRGKLIVGADFMPWLIVGMLGFLLFKNTMTRSMSAVRANRGLFAYRQVLPFDTVIARCLLEGALGSVVAVVLIFASWFFLDMKILPSDPLAAIVAWVCAWLLGVGFGLVLSVAATMAEEIEKVIGLASLPIMFFSGIILPVQAFPHWLQEWLIYNPVLHGVELIRAGFFETYHTVYGISSSYVWFWVVPLIFFGLALHVKHKAKLISE